MGAVPTPDRRRRVQLAAGLWTLGFAVAPSSIALRAGGTNVALLVGIALSIVAGSSCLIASVIYRAATRRPDSQWVWMLPGVVSVVVTLIAGVAALPIGSWEASVGLGTWASIIAGLHLATDRWAGDQAGIVPRPISLSTLSTASAPPRVAPNVVAEVPVAANDEPDLEMDEASEGPPRESRSGNEGDFISQWLTRVETASGTERLKGVVSLRFLPGQKHAAAHVPIVPPLAAKPRVVCDVIGDGTLRARVTAAEAYGVRIEVKQNQPAGHEQRVEVSFTAEAERTARGAA